VRRRPSPRLLVHGSSAVHVSAASPGLQIDEAAESTPTSTVNAQLAPGHVPAAAAFEDRVPETPGTTLAPTRPGGHPLPPRRAGHERPPARADVPPDVGIPPAPCLCTRQQAGTGQASNPGTGRATTGTTARSKTGHMPDPTATSSPGSDSGQSRASRQSVLRRSTWSGESRRCRLAADPPRAIRRVMVSIAPADHGLGHGSSAPGRRMEWNQGPGCEVEPTMTTPSVRSGSPAQVRARMDNHTVITEQAHCDQDIGADARRDPPVAGHGDIPNANTPLGLSRSHALAAPRGEYPASVHRLGGRHRVVTTSIVRLLSENSEVGSP
jgi:hypothetical protein